ncbi:MAG: PEP-utilizing enzyme [Prevotella sp.]|nr:PEP-utilizing enzyme [Prevotella sp.]
MVLAFVTVHGSLNSHTAILARTMGIPALVGTKVSLDDLTDGELSVSADSVLPIRKIIRETRVSKGKIC